METTNAIATTNEELNFRLAAMDGDMSESELSREELADQTKGLGTSFPKIKIPSGGAIAFEIPGEDPSSPDYVKFIQGVLIYHHPANGLWPEGSETEENMAPICFSNDGETGYGMPGGNCTTCSFNKFGSGSNGKGKMCKNMRHLYLMRDGDILPTQISLPPTSLKAFREFLNTSFLMKAKSPAGSLIEISLKKQNNGQDYSIACFRKDGDFTGETRQDMIAFARNYTERIKELNATKSAELALQNAQQVAETVHEFSEVQDDADLPFTAGNEAVMVGAGSTDMEYQAI